MSIKNNITLHNGTAIPGLGFRIDTSLEHIYADIMTALRAGYRLFDILAVPEIEKDFSKAIRATGVPRNELFLITHITPSSLNYEAGIHAYRNTLSRIGTDYSDATVVDITEMSKNPDQVIAQWRAAETAYKNGVTRTIGTCTPNTQDIELLLANCEIAPMMNIAAIYPGRANQEMIASCDEHRILLIGCMPEKEIDLVHSKELCIFADKYRVNPIDIQIQFLEQLNCLPLLTIGCESQQHKNFQASTFSISENDMKYLEAMKDYGK